MAATPEWFSLLEGQDDDPLTIPAGYTGESPLEDKGWSGLLPAVQEAFNTLYAAALKVGYTLRMTEGFRPRRRQAYLYCLGRTIKNPDGVTPSRPLGQIVTHALPGASNHQHRRAFDICIKGNDPYNEQHLAVIGGLGVKQGLSWGGNWQHQDTPHFEVPV